MSFRVAAPLDEVFVAFSKISGYRSARPWHIWWRVCLLEYTSVGSGVGRHLDCCAAPSPPREEGLGGARPRAFVTTRFTTSIMCCNQLPPTYFWGSS